jgi:hypothetical protein
MHVPREKDMSAFIGAGYYIFTAELITHNVPAHGATLPRVVQIIKPDRICLTVSRQNPQPGAALILFKWGRVSDLLPTVLW